MEQFSLPMKKLEPEQSDDGGMIMLASLPHFQRPRSHLRGGPPGTDWQSRSLNAIGQAGLTLLELLVGLAIVGTIGAMAIPNLRSNSLDLSSAVQQFVGELRIARARATNSGAHFRITLADTSYTIQRLQDDDDDGVWEPDSSFPAGSIDLPTNISMSVTDGDGIIEFTSRGLLEPRPGDEVAEIEKITISDAASGHTEKLEVWPSGQIQEV